MIDFNSNSAFTNVYLGSFQLSRMYVGDNQVWPETTPPPPTPTAYTEQYLTFRVQEGSTYFGYNKGNSSAPDIQYSLDSGSTWVSQYAGGSTPTISAGDTIMWKGTLSPTGSTGCCIFSNSEHVGSSFTVEGNVMSLLYGDDFADKTDLTEKGDHVFKSLFEGNQKLTSAENLVLPATALSNYCYQGMFKGCISMTTSPQLPSTILTDSCYYSMFSGCTALATAPVLPATTLASDCYRGMFYGCTGLTTSPVLPAATLVSGSYREMFYGCRSLNNITCLATDKSASLCTWSWVYNVSSTGTFTKNASMTGWSSGTSGIPSNWTVVDAS